MGRGPPLTNHRSDSINIFHFQMALWKRCNEYAPRNVFGHRTTGPWTSDPPWRGEVWVLTLDGSLCCVFRLDILTLRVPFWTKGYKRVPVAQHFVPSLISRLSINMFPDLLQGQVQFVLIQLHQPLAERLSYFSVSWHSGGYTRGRAKSNAFGAASILVNCW